jgi:hypothetical protein
VWFDKLTVDDWIANRLFDKDSAANLDRFIKSEVQEFGNSIDVFFVDELVYSQYPCYKYVQDSVRQYNLKFGKNAKMSHALSTNLNMFSLRNNSNAFNFRLDVTDPDIIQIDAHSITWTDSNHTAATFDRRSGSYINFGLFQPGEGKLYKLAPVMQERSPGFCEYLSEQD